MSTSRRNWSPPQGHLLVGSPRKQLVAARIRFETQYQWCCKVFRLWVVSPLLLTEDPVVLRFQPIPERTAPDQLCLHRVAGQSLPQAESCLRYQLQYANMNEKWLVSFSQTRLILSTKLSNRFWDTFSTFGTLTGSVLEHHSSKTTVFFDFTSVVNEGLERGHRSPI